MRIIIRSRSRSTWPTASDTGLAALRLDSTSLATVIASAPDIQALWAVRVDRGVAGPDAARSLVEISPASTGAKQGALPPPDYIQTVGHLCPRINEFPLPTPFGPFRLARPRAAEQPTKTGRPSERPVSFSAEKPRITWPIHLSWPSTASDPPRGSHTPIHCHTRRPP